LARLRQVRVLRAVEASAQRERYPPQLTLRALPGARQTLVFLSGNGAAAVRCASIAANMGLLRCAVLEGGLEALGGGGASRAPRFTYISRCGLKRTTLWAAQHLPRCR
jgi:hypothetical protein